MILVRIAAGNYVSVDGTWRVMRFERKASSDWCIYRDDERGREVLEGSWPTLRDCRAVLAETVEKTLTDAQAESRIAL